MEEKTLLEIIYRIKNLLGRNEIFEAKEYIELELNNLNGITQEQCKNTKYHFYPTYCKYCSNTNCESNRNIDLKDSI